MPAALGFRTHSGWAAVVALALSEEGPVVCDRRMVVLADAEIPGSKQPYHSAEHFPLEKAKQYLRRCADATYQLALSSLEAIVDSLHQKGLNVVGCGLIAASGRTLPSVEAILASHAAIHTAEGEMYRAAIARACETRNLPLARVKEKGALEVAEQALGLKGSTVEKRVEALGKPLGPPWSQDQKLASLAAWVALANATSSRRVKAAGRKA